MQKGMAIFLLHLDILMPQIDQLCNPLCRRGSTDTTAITAVVCVGQDCLMKPVPVQAGFEFRLFFVPYSLPTHQDLFLYICK